MTKNYDVINEDRHGEISALIRVSKTSRQCIVHQK